MMIFLAILAGIILYVVAIYNKLVLRRTQVDEGWSGISVQLKRRHDLIPNIVNTVKGYASHEADLLKDVTELRNKSTSVAGVGATATAEAALSAGITRLLAVAENYPDLKANTNFLQLQSELSEIENSLQHARRYYNGGVRDYEVLRNSFPSNLIANNFGFVGKEYFELADAAVEGAVPNVQF